jgi:hypothetical protein
MKQDGYTEGAIVKQMKLNGVASMDAFNMLDALAAAEVVHTNEAESNTAVKEKAETSNVDVYAVLEPYR